MYRMHSSVRSIGVVSLCAALVLAATVRGADDFADEFRRRDENGDGFLSGRESRDIREFDADKDGDVSPAEFAAGMRRMQVLDSTGDPNKAFAALDINGDGTLSGKEAKGLERYDVNGDGEVSREEFPAKRVDLNPGTPTPESEKTITDVSGASQARSDRRFAEYDARLNKEYDTGKKWAVVIGIGAYPDEPLPYTVADARLMAESLEKHCGFSPEQIKLLVDDQADERLRPTKKAISETIRDTLEQAQPDDCVVVFFAGHGKNQSEKGYLCPIDLDINDLPATAWPTDELRSLFEACPATRKLLVLDSRHSDGTTPPKKPAESKDAKVADDLKQKDRGDNLKESKDSQESTEAKDKPLPEAVSTRYAEVRGLITLASSENREISHVSDKLDHGCFTYAVCRGLAGEADLDGNLIVDVDELYRFVSKEVSEQVVILTDNKRRQTPSRIVGKDVVVWPLARVRRGELLENSIGMKFVRIPKGLFVQGSPTSEFGRNEDETAHIVELSRFDIAAYEVTQAQFVRIMGTNPSWYSATGEGRGDVAGLDTSDFPVEQVDYRTAAEFCRLLSSLPEEQAAKRAYRLPTEAEWEYGCRAGSRTPFSTGLQINSRQANLRGDLSYGGSAAGPSLGRTTTVGLYPPNAFGLYDMHGNVAEWCADYYGRYEIPFYLTNDQIEDRLAAMARDPNADKGKYLVDPKGELLGSQRVYRGGAFMNDPALCRAALRRSRDPSFKSRALGFRVVVEFK